MPFRDDTPVLRLLFRSLHLYPIFKFQNKITTVLRDDHFPIRAIHLALPLVKSMILRRISGAPGPEYSLALCLQLSHCRHVVLFVEVRSIWKYLDIFGNTTGY